MWFPSFRQGIARNCKILNSINRIAQFIQGIARFCILLTVSLNSIKEMQDFALHSKVCKELHGNARNPHGICNILYYASTKEDSSFHISPATQFTFAAEDFLILNLIFETLLIKWRKFLIQIGESVAIYHKINHLEIRKWGKNAETVLNAFF